jgi:hypothetical protein
MALILSGDTGVPASGMPTGSVIQTVTAVKTDTSTNSTTTYADISGLSVTITPISTSSKILVTLNLCGSNDGGSMAVQLVRDSTPIALGTAASGSQLNVTESNYYNNGDANSMRSSGIVYMDSPATTSAVTYKVQFRSGTSGNSYVNRPTGTDNASYNMRTISTITAQEIKQ